eukprot:5812971-Pyramimonas_sp.AAC.1
MDARIKPERIAKHTDDGSDDCWGDLSGMGKDIALMVRDVHFEDLHECGGDSDYEDIFWDIDSRCQFQKAHIFCIFSTFCYVPIGYQDLA